MYEYSVPEAEHIRIPPGTKPSDLLLLTVGILGDEAANLCNQYLERGTLYTRISVADRQGLQFAASFFYAYVESKFDSEIDDELLTLAAASFYLGETPGSTLVISRMLDSRQLDNSGSLAAVVRRVLSERWRDWMPEAGDRFATAIGFVLRSAGIFLSTEGVDERLVLRHCAALRKEVYARGSAHELAYADLLVAIVLRKLANSSRRTLPAYSRLDEEQWAHVLRKKNFVGELWPAQHLLGQEGLYAGASAVIQMPTSAGKSRAIELIIRSAFISRRAKAAVVVAPFRALCQEISNSLRAAFTGEMVSVSELTDVLQQDFRDVLGGLFGNPFGYSSSVLVVTPEKLLYVLRQQPELADAIGLVVYDEGHQFDSGSRGATYELLLTTLKQLIPQHAQVVLISAVIANGRAVADWLIGKHARVVAGNSLVPMLRSVVFASWRRALGTLEFDVLGGPNDPPYFVPRVIEPIRLTKFKRERLDRDFPKKDDPLSIALYLGLKLAAQGSVAIFCGLKGSVSTLVKMAADCYRRDLPYASPAQFADPAELGKLVTLHTKHFGVDSFASGAARLGMLMHHGNIPQGIRTCVEHAMREELIPLVICTSTLAQGVNLPLRYLVVPTTLQAGERIKVRDFQNLMGRTGRAGMHIEGSVIFADPRLYDGRAGSDGWKWRGVQHLLDAENMEPSGSSLFELLEPIVNDDRTMKICDTSVIIGALVEGKTQAFDLVTEIISRAPGLGMTTSAKRQVDLKWRLVTAVASFLQANRGEKSFDDFMLTVTTLAQSTLAYALGNVGQRISLIGLFNIIAEEVDNRVPDSEAQHRNSRTLLSIGVLEGIYTWCQNNFEKVVISSRDSESALLDTIWPLLDTIGDSEIFARCIRRERLLLIAQLWISGASYRHTEEAIHQEKIAKQHGEQSRKFTTDDVVELCDNCFGYEFSLYFTALVTYFETANEELVVERLKLLQSELKYGLPDRLSIAIHEAGFTDRMLAQDLKPICAGIPATKGDVLEHARNSPQQFDTVLAAYPSYFSSVLQSLR
ncbi:DEAD/DEAH box helicase [Cupriavidus basilensis]|uniref:DEAD/DEAH box helicase n=1 Tax=Cupriavidus basilensis TaxID=68895 RepID=A0A7M2GU59_9BURK|nr:DEAD/DEAH box helicase [Cupriavidus basilensis]QOT76336.1 DEAD/DEAH box helicase [Cupriavidus basilensis]